MSLNGVDVASYQAGINFGKVTSPDFAIIKGTGGTGYVNPYCDAQFQSAKKNGKLLGVYHYANEVGYEGSAKAEAKFFVKNCKNYLKGDAIPILDWEAQNKGDVKWALTWLKEVEKLTGIKPWFYTYTGVLNSFNFSSIAKNDNALWVAAYGQNLLTNGFKKPNPPKTPGFPQTACFQYSSNTRIPGWGASIDVNVFYGDKKAWKAYATPKGKAAEKKEKKEKDWSKKYYTTNPKKVKLLKNDGLYGKNDVAFKKGKTGGTFKKGTNFNITGIKKRSDGLPRLVTESGYLLTANRKYVQKVSGGAKKPAAKGTGWIKQNATFTSNQAIYLRTSASTSAGTIALLPAGSKIKYNAFKRDANGYVWIRQKRSNGYGYIATGNTKNGKRTSSWGTFK